MNRPKAAPAIMLGTTTHVLDSAFVENALQIDISFPNDYETSTSVYPTVYLIDGNAFFPVVSHAIRPLETAGELPPIIIVGVGYAPVHSSHCEESERVARLRLRDLTPTRDDSEWWRQRGIDQSRPDIDTGRASAFADAIEFEVKPLVRQHYRADPDDETLAGYSLGGLFTLYMLLKDSSRFGRYISGSPSLWWDDGALFEMERRYGQSHEDLPAKLFLSIGSLEEVGMAAPMAMVSSYNRLSTQLVGRAYPSLDFHSLVLDDETHASAICSTFLKGLRWMFAHPFAETPPQLGAKSP